MINITDKSQCCGCNACGDVCAKHAITFKTDLEGFWYPEVNKDLCIDCGLCEKVCPVINIKELKKNDYEKPKCYVAEHKNLEVVFDSTSGGLFSALADIMYKSKGYVGGAVYNEDFSVKQYISADKADLEKLRSSKYLQSNLEGFFSQVKELLKAEEQVLVCGCPCQMTALRSFLRKDYENLIIVDFICRGINSPKIWRKYLDTYEERYGSKVVYVKSKSKELGWRNLTQKTILADGQVHYEKKNENLYTIGYLRTGAYCRPSCYECKFKGYPRIADISIADFWGVERIQQSKIKDKNLGLSLVMVNSQKGEKYFEKVKSRLNFLEVPFGTIEVGNPSLNLPVAKPKVDRKLFFEDADRMTFTELANKYFPKKETITLKQKVVRSLLYIKSILHITQLKPKPIYQFFKYNTMREILSGNVIIPTPYCVISIGENATIKKTGITILGNKLKFRKSHLETRLVVDNGGTLILGPNLKIGYGSDIEVFSGATLEFKGDGGSNIGLTCICGDHIVFGKGVMIGRNCTVRDNNGSHYINRQGYKNTVPVIIGDKAWLCEQCTIMNGVKVGAGAIIGAKSFVITNVPANAMVSGHPAKVVDTDVLWKY